MSRKNERKGNVKGFWAAAIRNTREALLAWWFPFQKLPLSIYILSHLVLVLVSVHKNVFSSVRVPLSPVFISQDLRFHSFCHKDSAWNKLLDGLGRKDVDEASFRHDHKMNPHTLSSTTTTQLSPSLMRLLLLFQSKSPSTFSLRISFKGFPSNTFSSQPNFHSTGSKIKLKEKLNSCN